MNVSQLIGYSLGMCGKNVFAVVIRETFSMHYLRNVKPFFFLKHTGRAALPILGHMGYPARIASYLQQTIISE